MRATVCRGVAVGAVLGLALSVAPGRAGASPEPGRPGEVGTAGTASAATGRTYQVTLVTGDVVHVTRTPDGRTQAAVEPGTGPSTAFRVFELRGHTHVVPLRAQPYLDRGLLDPRLFDVTALVEQGYHDAATSRIPLIVEYRPGPAAARTAVPAGARGGAVLEGLDARAVVADKANAEAFWTDVVGGGPATASLGGGVERIWLDARTHALLDRSTAWIGAPQAWEVGLDGSAVRVAVLDTGLDASHGDFAGSVVGSRSFTPDGTTEDRVGHGTHVASILAGSGAESDGTHRGVAPGSDLLIGKVLGDDARGLSSWIIDGMEWAVAEGAQVVNLSLGAYPTDGTDPMSQAVNALTAESGALFVIAAGNDGPSARTVSAPAAADAALAVGNARLDGTLAFRSSRGPRVIDNAIKPEITAPGTGIVAARVGGGYRAMSGTSMAAPHVAGAAAILAQQHPDWDATRLKAALVANSVPLTDATVWEQGAGRVAVDRAVEQTVRVSDAVLDLGYYARGADGLTTTRTLTYTNDGTEAVTLDLAVSVTDDDGTRAPAGTVTVRPERVSLEPGASTEVTVRLDASLVSPAQYAGRLVATGGPHPLTTAVGFYRQGDMVDVTITMTDRRGQPAGGYVTLYNYELGVFEPFGYIFGTVAAGQARTFRIPRDTYSITAVVATRDQSGRFRTNLSLVADPQRELDHNTRITADARTAEPVEVRTPREAVPEVLVLGWTRGADEGSVFVDSILSLPAGGGERLSATPTEAVTDGRFDVYTTWHLAVPWLTVETGGATFRPSYLTGSPRYVGRDRFPAADGTGPADHVAVLREDPAVPIAEQVRAAADRGAVLALVTPAVPGVLRGVGFGLPIPTATLTYDEGERLRDLLGRHGRVELTGVLDSPYTYDLILHSPDRVGDPSQTVRRRDLAAIDARYHGNGQRGAITRYPVEPCLCSLVRILERHAFPYERTEYVSTGEAVWSASVTSGLTSNLRMIERGYEPGGHYTETWGRAPLAPNPSAGRVSVRDGDTLRLRVSAIGDAGGHIGGSLGSSTGLLFREGEQVAELFAGFGEVDVPAEPADYRLRVDSANGDGLSTRSSTTWTFRSGHVDGEEALSLLSPRVHLPVSVTNAVGEHRLVPAVITAGYPGGEEARPRSARVWVSYDDGARWTRVLAFTLFGRTLALLPPARWFGGDAEYASLRVALTDRSGNTVDQTITRAYRLN